MITTLIADDQPLVRSGLRAILEREPDITVVAEAGTGVEAVAAARAHRPDVVLMDVRMPAMDGLTATRLVLAGPAPVPKVVVLTTFDLDEYVHAGLRAGASGFILKDCQPEELVRAVRAVADGDAMLAPSVTRRIIASYVAAPAPAATLPARLTDRETEVLMAMAEGLSNAEVAALLFLGEATVKTHVTSILAKLGVRDRLQAVIVAYESGLVRPGHRRTC